jgi:2-polyprenyl-3-methyl-5-hydroxy-6-metoxy-1,4-benzoquinol methylase
MPLRSTALNVSRALEKAMIPGLTYSQYLYEDVLNSHLNAQVEWLDVGCGHHFLPHWRGEQEKAMVARCRKVVGIDADLASLKKHRSIPTRVLGTIDSLPFHDESFDVVTANMVVEHLEAPDTQFREIARILKPNGIFIMHTPNRRGYSTLLARLIPEGWKKALIRVLQGRAEGDVFKTFYRANTPVAIEQSAHATGFDVRQLKMIVTNAQLGVIPPLAFFELMWIRILMTRQFKGLRTNIIGILQKRQPSEAAAEVGCDEKGQRVPTT